MGHAAIGSELYPEHAIDKAAFPVVPFRVGRAGGFLVRLAEQRQHLLHAHPWLDLALGLLDRADAGAGGESIDAQVQEGRANDQTNDAVGKEKKPAKHTVAPWVEEGAA